jgi:hypothetical protein
MRGFPILAVTLAGLTLAACASDPNAAVNQTFPIRQMDSFFNSLSGAPPAPRAAQVPPPPDYTRTPGYAPAYPPYNPSYE